MVILYLHFVFVSEENRWNRTGCVKKKTRVNTRVYTSIFCMCGICHATKINTKFLAVEMTHYVHIRISSNVTTAIITHCFTNIYTTYRIDNDCIHINV